MENDFFELYIFKVPRDSYILIAIGSIILKIEQEIGLHRVEAVLQHVKVAQLQLKKVTRISEIGCG